MKRKTAKEYLNLFREKFGDKFKYDASTIKSSNVKINIECQEHGVFFQSPREHLRSKYGCPKCWASSYSKSKKFTNSQYVSECIKIHGDRYDYKNTNYTGSSNYVEVICKTHGPFLVLAFSHLAGTNCALCSREVTNKKLLKHIQENKISEQEFIKRSKDKYNDNFDYSLSVYKDFFY